MSRGEGAFMQSIDGHDALCAASKTITVAAVYATRFGVLLALLLFFEGINTDRAVSIRLDCLTSAVECVARVVTDRASFRSRAS